MTLGSETAGPSTSVGMNKPGGSTRESRLISHISPKTSEIWGTHKCGWVRVLRAVPFTLNLPSGKSFARDDNSMIPATREPGHTPTQQQNCHPDRSGGTCCFASPVPVSSPVSRQSRGSTLRKGRIFGRCQHLEAGNPVSLCSGWQRGEQNAFRKRSC
jgi:hypothetical protein